MFNKISKSIVAVLLVLSTAAPSFAAFQNPIANPEHAACRLTLQSGTPVADVASGSTIYLDPYQGNIIAGFDTTRQIWVEHPLNAEIGYLMSGLTANQMYSLYIYWTGTAWAFDTPVIWTNSSTPDAQTVLNGVTVKATDYSRRYVGCFFTLTANTTEDDKTQRLICNAQKRERRYIYTADPTSSWTVSGTTPHGANYNYATGSARSVFVTALPSVVEVNAYQYYAINPAQWVAFGIGLDTVTAFNYYGQCAHSGTYDPTIGATITVTGAFNGLLGFHYIQRMEENVSGATTITGYNVNAMVTYVSN